MQNFPSLSLESVSDFCCVERPTEILPPAPDFMFGAPAKEVLASYFTSRYIHEVGVYKTVDVILEDAALLLVSGEYIVAPQVNLHADKVAGFVAQRPSDDNRPLARIDAPCALIAGPGQNVFGHWLVDFLPKLHLLDAAGYDVNRLKYVFAKAIPKFGPEFLKMLGIPEENIILHDFDSKRLAIRSLCIPTKMHNGVRSCKSLTAAADFLARRAGLVAGEHSSGRFPQRVWISRSGWKSRSLLNRQMIEEIALQWGFSSVSPERLPLRDQAELFFGAREIIGEYGSGLHGTIFSPPGVTVCALRGSSFQPMFIQSALGAAIGQPTGYSFGATDNTEPLEPFSIDLDVFHDCLAAVFPRPRQDLGIQATKLSATVTPAEDVLLLDATSDPATADPDPMVLSLIRRIAEWPQDHDARSCLSELLKSRKVNVEPDSETIATPVNHITVDFGHLGNSFEFCKKGWWGPEARSRWSMGAETEMLVKNLDDTQDCRIVVDLVPFLAAPAVVRQRMVLQINHVVVGYFSVGRISQIECFVPAEILQLKPITSLLFSCPDHASPAQLNINGDGRDMAFSFSRLVICPAYVHTLA